MFSEKTNLEIKFDKLENIYSLCYLELYRYVPVLRTVNSAYTLSNLKRCKLLKK